MNQVKELPIWASSTYGHPILIFRQHDNGLFEVRIELKKEFELVRLAEMGTERDPIEFQIGHLQDGMSDIRELHSMLKSYLDAAAIRLEKLEQERVRGKR